MGTKQKPIAYLTQLRAFSCMAIVFLHTFYAASAYAAVGSLSYITAQAIRNLMLWAVPCFVMISGALLLRADKEVTYKKLFGKYILRIVLALVLFTLLFALLDADSLGFSVVLTGLQQIYTNSSWNHMWYLYMMLAIYLMLPLYRKIAAALTKKDAYYLLGVYVLFLSLLPMVENLTDTSAAFYICVYSVYPLYLFLGYIISQGMFSRARRIDGTMAPCPYWVWVVLTLVGTLGELTLTLCSEKLGWETLSQMLTKYSFPLILVQAVGIFGMFYGKKAKMPKWLDWILRQIDACSFGIYLIHMIFLKVVFVWCSWNPYEHGGTGMVFLLTIAVLLCSFACVWILKKIPGLRWLL